MVAWQDHYRGNCAMSIPASRVPHRSYALPNAKDANPVECPFLPLWTASEEVATSRNSI